MQQQKYQTYLLTRILERNDFGSIRALVKAIEEAKAIPEDTQWTYRKAAFNAIAEKAPMRKDVDSYCLVHADIPEFLATEWNEFNTFQTMTRGRKGADHNDAVTRFWQVAQLPQ